ncbi:MAG: CAP domain-containing protein [Planctomycetes bacterium]|nr:CAP domain-containing protein [Planctomycetota bacterium]
MKVSEAMRTTAALVCGGLLPAQEPLVPRADLRGLEHAAVELARSGRPEEWSDLIAVLAQLGMPGKDLAKLRAAGEKSLAQQKKPLEDGSRPAKALREAATLLASRLPQVATGEPAAHFARQLLALDADIEAANVALGHARIGTHWVVAEEMARKAKRDAIQRTLQDVRRRPVAVGMSESKGDEADAQRTGAALLAAVLGRPVVKVTFDNLTVHSSRSAEQTRRIVVQTLRAHAFARFALDGKLEIPALAPLQTVIVDSRIVYERCIEVAAQRGWLALDDANEARKLGAFYLTSGALVDHGITESQAESALLVAIDRQRLCQEALTAGHLNWVCKAVLGTPIPTYVWDDVKYEPDNLARTSAQDGRAAAEREEFRRLSEAGLAGGRAYLRYLAARREDPPWSAGLLPKLGQIQGENLLKATFVAEFLVEEGRLLALNDSLLKVGTAGTLPEIVGTALDEPLASFEERWRTWLVGLPPGLVQRLQQKPTELDREVQSTLQALDALRANAFGAASAWLNPVPPISFDAELSRGCQAHAAYLVRHPEQSARWPDVHEENPDHADWSAAGAWAGGHSVIACGAKNGATALHSWMGTFYHRLLLLDPGLVRVGLGQSRDVVVLDSGSMVASRQDSWHVAWPPDGMTDVPVRFVPELPNPVPGEDQAQWGYPITLQLGVRTSHNEPEVTMRLNEGAATGKAVPCWFVSPQQPTNRDIAPEAQGCRDRSRLADALGS